MDIPICQKCKMRVFPKSDGTCPNCGTIIEQGKSTPPGRSQEVLPPNKGTFSKPKPVSAKPSATQPERLAPAKNPDPPPFDEPAEENQERAQEYFNRAQEYNQNSEYEKALKACDQAIELVPCWSDAHDLRGVILEDMGLLEQAIAEYRTATRLEPADMEAKENLALALKESAKARKRGGNEGMVEHVKLSLEKGEKMLCVTRWAGGCRGLFWVILYVATTLFLAGVGFIVATVAYARSTAQYNIPVWLLMLVYLGIISMIWDLISHVISLFTGRAVLTNRRIVIRNIPRLGFNYTIRLEEVQELDTGKQYLIWRYGMLFVKTRSGAQKKLMVYCAKDFAAAYHRFRMDQQKNADEDPVEAAIAARRAARTAKPAPIQATPDAYPETAVVRLPSGSGEEAARFCTNCGKPLVASDRFCAACGSAVKAKNLPHAPLPEKKEEKLASSPLLGKTAGKRGEYGFFEMGKEQQGLGKWSEALHHFRQAIEVEPGRSDAYFEAHACLLQLKRFDEALGCLDKMVELEPNSADSVEYHRRNIARQRLVFQDMMAEQVKDITPMLDLIRNKDDEEVKHSIGNLNFDPIFLAKVLWSAKLSPEALLQLRGIGLSDENEDVRFSAVAILGVKKYREALNELLYMLAKDPSPRVRCVAAASLNMIGDPEALPWLKKIAEIDPVDVVREAASDALRKLELRTKIFRDLP